MIPVGHHYERMFLSQANITLIYRLPTVILVQWSITMKWWIRFSNYPTNIFIVRTFRNHFITSASYAWTLRHEANISVYYRRSCLQRWQWAELYWRLSMKWWMTPKMWNYTARDVLWLIRMSILEEYFAPVVSTILYDSECNTYNTLCQSELKRIVLLPDKLWRNKKFLFKNLKRFSRWWFQ